jgi:hypothetical protein
VGSAADEGFAVSIDPQRVISGYLAIKCNASALCHCSIRDGQILAPTTVCPPYGFQVASYRQPFSQLGSQRNGKFMKPRIH